MTVDEVMEYRRAVPFKPFMVRLKDGREFKIRHPLNIGRDPDSKYLMVGFGDVVQGELVSSVEMLDELPATSPGSNK